jgi:hypothetical protein
MRLYLIFPLLVLTGCGNSLERLRAASPSADNFASALAAEYLAYSESEAEQKNTEIAEHFAQKGLDALAGSEVLPENPASLTAERASLLRSLTPEVRRVAAQKAARAQLLFDCWSTQSAASGNKDTPCKLPFEDSLSALQEVSDSVMFGADSEHVIYFSPEGAGLNAEMKARLSEVAKHLTTQPDTIALLQPHHNVQDTLTARGKLIRQRMNNITAALVHKGISQHRISPMKPTSPKAVCLSSDEVMLETDEVDILIRSTATQEGSPHE